MKPTQPNAPAKTIAYAPQTRDPGPAPATDHPTMLQPPDEALPPEALAPISSGAINVPGYEVLGELGRGGMGVVYKARQTGLNRLVALKMILAGSHAGGALLTRFKAEAETVARLSHPNIVQVYDVGEHEGLPFIALEYVEGGSLEQKLKGIPQTPRAAAYLVEVAGAIHAAHEAGVIHRDLKPANILVSDRLTAASYRSEGGESSATARSVAHSRSLTAEWHPDLPFGVPKITDFGLAKQIDSQAAQTHTGSIMGTPSYMSPEQAAGRTHEIGPPADIYALGALLYELLTGRPPFRADTPLNTIMQVMHGEPVPVRHLQHKCPRDLETICLKCLQKEPRRRYASALALAEDLHRFREDEPILARPSGPWERALKWVRRRPAVAALLSVVVLALVALAAGGTWAYVAVSTRARETEEANRKVNQALEEGRQRMVRLSVANGVRQMDSHDLFLALLWFAEALHLEVVAWSPDHATTADAALMHRKRLAVVLGQCPRLEQLWLHEGQVTSASFSPDGKRVVTAGSEGIARVWDAATGEAVSRPMEHGGPILFAPFSPDGKVVLTGGADGRARIWEAATGKALVTIDVGAPLACAAFHPDSRRVALGDRAGGLRIWDVVTGQGRGLKMLHDGPVQAVAFSPKDDLLASASDDHTARLWDAGSGEPAFPPLRHNSPVRDVHFSPDGEVLLSADAGGEARLWKGVRLWKDDKTRLALVRSLRHGKAAITRAAFRPDGRWVVTASLDYTAQVWDVATGQPVGAPLRHSSRVDHVAFSPDGMWLLTASEDNDARVWDAATGRLAAPVLRHNGTPTQAIFSPGGDQVLTASADGLARLWDLATDRAIASERTASRGTLPLAESSGTAESRDGKLVVTYGGEHTARIRDAHSLDVAAPPLKHDAPITFATFSPDSTRIVTTAEDGTVQLWEATTGRPIFPHPLRHASKVFQAAFSPDGTLLATASDDNTARVWDAATGVPRTPPIRHSGSVYHVEFCTTGRCLFTASTDGTSRVWDVATGEPLTPALPAWDGASWKADLPADAHRVADLLDLARVLSGQSVDEAGGMMPLDSVTLRNTWRRLRSHHPSDFRVSPEQRKAWRVRQAEGAKKAQNWYATAWHLDRLIEAEPASAEFLQQRAHARAQLSDWPNAVLDAERAIRLRPGTWEGWYERGIAYSQQGKWNLAVADLAQAARLADDPEIGEALVASVRLQAGDLTGYRQACATLLEKYGKTDDGVTARRIAWACVLAPDAVGRPAAVIALAEKAVARRPRDGKALATLGAALYRAGRSDEAIKRLHEALKLREELPGAWPLLAMAYHRLGQPAEASRWRERAGKWLSTHLPEQSGPGAGSLPLSWQQQTDLRLLWREAVEQASGDKSQGTGPPG